MAVNCLEIEANSNMSEELKGMLFSKSLLPFTPLKIISPSDAIRITPEKFSETAALLKKLLEKILLSYQENGFLNL